MTLNPFFLQGSAREQFLIQDLINEQLKIYGIDVYYLPRKFLKTDDILREVQSSKFDDNFIIEAYLDNYEGYAPGSDLMTKFGLRLKNEINLVISQERFQEFISPFLYGIQKGIDNNTITDYDINLPSRPREGDLIYFPLGQRLFEIKRVESEKPFYQLGKTYVYELLCELYEYENEDIDTSISEIDGTVQDEGYITTLSLEGLGVTATATATLAGDGMIGRIVLVDDGYNYTSTPTVTISPSPTNNPANDATAVAITTAVGGVRSVESIRITNAGFGYDPSNPPTVTITGGSGAGAAATAVVVNDGIRTLSISTAGSGYYIEPIVSIDPPLGGGAEASAVVGVAGTVESLSVTYGGEFYSTTSPPSVTISDPPTSAQIKFGNNSLYHDSLTDVTTIGTFTSTASLGASQGISIRFWIYPISQPLVGTNYSILHTPDFKIHMNATSYELNYNFSSFSGVTSDGEVLIPDQWNYVQLDCLDTSVRFSVNDVSGGIFIAGSGDLFTSGQSIKVGDAQPADSVADFADRSFIGYIDDISIETITSFPTNISSPTTSRSGNFFTNTLDSSTATATANVGSSGTVSSLTITSGGSGYFGGVTATVSIANTVGNKDYDNFGIKGATARAILAGDGSISSLQIVNTGYGYTSTPNVTITGVSTTGIGTYILNETITGSLSGTTAEIKDINLRTDLDADNPPIDLYVGSNDGQFSAGEVITGSKSGASYILKSYDNDSYEESYDINEEIETEADGILDFTETNPFGEY